MKKKYSLESFSAGHFFEEFVSEDSFYFKKFFGGLSIYIHGKMVAFLADSPGLKEWRGKKYPFDIWNGCLIPSDREHHSFLLKKIKGTLVHPTISKWLYLPQSSKHFETSMFQLVEMIEKKNPQIGIEPEMKSKKNGKPKKKLADPKTLKISEMLNLGPAVEKDFNAIGIFTASQILKLGPEKAFVKMLKGRLKLDRSAKCCNALYLYSLYGAIHNIHWTQIPEKKKKEFKIYSQKLRDSGKFGKY
jgi:hypothetical protein